jgi:DnaJ-class molecular chaperone
MASAPPSYVEGLRAFARQIFPELDQRSYYELLNIQAEADVRTVRAAFYRLAAQLHPDRFHTLPQADVREQLETIYARICEAYRVLSHPERRAAYNRGLTTGKKRFELGGRETAGPRNPEDSIKHPEAKKFFRLGMVCLGKKDWKGAVMNFQFAKNFEPSSQLVSDRLAEAQSSAGAAKAGGAK